MPSPAWIRDGIFAILDRHGALDPAAPGRFADISAREPIQGWGTEVLSGAVIAGPEATQGEWEVEQAYLDYTLDKAITFRAGIGLVHQEPVHRYGHDLVEQEWALTL